jgi:hypothetical protein
MRGERRLLRLGEYLVGRACRRLPPDVREERCREWAAELPAILHDPQVRFAPRRAARMLGYAADTLRGTIMTPGGARSRIPHMFAGPGRLLLVAGLAVMAWNVWALVQAPGNGLNYLQLAWSLLFVAYLICKRARAGLRVTAVLGISAALALAAILVGQAAQAPGDWVNYFLAALFLLPFLIGLPLVWWFRRLEARSGGRHAAPSDPRSFTLYP